MAGSRCRILVIEDDPETGNQLVQSLARMAIRLISPPTEMRGLAAHLRPNMAVPLYASMPKT
jgi:hypothetical protein